jgi:hypothetical protein
VLPDFKDLENDTISYDLSYNGVHWIFRNETWQASRKERWESERFPAEPGFPSWFHAEVIDDWSVDAAGKKY